MVLKCSLEKKKKMLIIHTMLCNMQCFIICTTLVPAYADIKILTCIVGHSLTNVQNEFEL